MVFILYPLILRPFTLTILLCLMLSSRVKNYDDTLIKDQAQLIFLNVIWSDTLYVEQRHIQGVFYLTLPFPDLAQLLQKLAEQLAQYLGDDESAVKSRSVLIQRFTELHKLIQCDADSQAAQAVIDLLEQKHD